MNIAVYCGSASGNRPSFTEGAKALGSWIAQNGHTLVYGGSRTGLMGATADAVLAGGGKVIGEFTCERIALIAYDGGELSSTTNAAFSPATCLTQAEIIAYIGDKGRCYGWYISDLRIYDTPRELSEFTGLRNTRFGAAPYDIKRAPQSWCYVEVMEDV